MYISPSFGLFSIALGVALAFACASGELPDPARDFPPDPVASHDSAGDDGDQGDDDGDQGDDDDDHGDDDDCADHTTEEDCEEPPRCIWNYLEDLCEPFAGGDEDACAQHTTKEACDWEEWCIWNPLEQLCESFPNDDDDDDEGDSEDEDSDDSDSDSDGEDDCSAHTTEEECKEDPRCIWNVLEDECL